MINVLKQNNYELDIYINQFNLLLRGGILSSQVVQN